MRQNSSSHMRIDKGKGKADEQPPKKRFSWRIRAKKVEKQRNDLRAALSQPIPRDTSANPVEDSQSPPQPVISLPGFYSTSLAPSDQSQAPPSPNPSISQGNWSDIQRWYNENHAGVRGLSPPPVNPDLDDDYVQYLNELPNNENDYEEEHLSSIQENEPVLGQPGYAPRAPAYDSNTREWYHFFDDVSLSAREVQCPSTPKSSLGPSLQFTSNSKSAKAKAKGKGKTRK
nr:hypothetical protein Iba_chr09cCG11040 [Ipomoea batatas]